MSIENSAPEEFNKPMENLESQELSPEVRVTTILEKGQLEPAEVKLLENWLEKHRGFGLEEIGDSEYYDFFQNGRFYLHSSAIFAGRLIGGADRMKPMFLEALKDGYMIGRQIAEERGKPKIGGSVKEKGVSFDNQDIFIKNALVRHHFKYALEGPMYKFAPVVLVAPAKLLESHSNLISGQGEGVYFGSSDKDPNAPSHEIPMSLFVMIIPDIKMRSSFIKKTIESLASDKRTEQIAKSDELKKYIDESKKRDIGLKEFMETLLSLLHKDGVSIPRLFFYRVKTARDLECYNAEMIEKGVREFLESHNIPLHAELDTNKKSTSFKKIVDVKKLEVTSNLVRKKLKQIASAA